MTELVREPLGSQIAHVLRRDIVFGRLRPGTALQQQQLCERFETSRMPIRDALHELAFEGLVVKDGTRHHRVAPLSRDDLEDIYLIEGTLHGMATRRFVAKASEDDITMLEELHEAMMQACEHGDSERMAELNWDFHRRINRVAGSAKLMTALRVLSLRIPREYVVEMPDWMEVANKEHRLILDAIGRRDADSAEELMTKHVRDAGDNLITFLEQQGLEFT
jgi:DNA-binding GntR family transcriptional regulator